jgi:hypothetical protein
VNVTHHERAERRRHIAEDVVAGVTQAAVLEKHGVSSDTLRQACIEHGVKCPMVYAERATRRKRIAEELAAGVDEFAIATKYGVAMSFVVRIRTTSGIKAARRLCGSTYAIIAELFGEENFTVIAAKHGVTRQRAEQIACKCELHGIPIRRRTRKKD